MTKKYINRIQISTHFTLSVIAIVCFIHSALPDAFAQTNHLVDGIAFYNEGRYDEALEEFREKVEINSHCPLAYYYAAKIRILRTQYSRAIQNLEAALRDSSDFYDANGLLAVTLQKSGFGPEALVEWNTFINAVGIIEGGSPPANESIMMPEEYHKLLELETERKERERLEAERIENERLRAEKIKADGQTNNTSEDTPPALEIADNNMSSTEETRDESAGVPIGLSDEGDADAEIEFPFDDLTQRINSSIRRGIYAIIIGICFSIVFTITAVYFIRKRKSAYEESNFSEEVERIINDREFELSEEKSIREFEEKKRELLQTVQSQKVQPSNESSVQTEPPASEQETASQAKEEYVVKSVSNSMITEEIKALVSRLHREGHSAEKISKISDLSKTEVELILAVREQHFESIVNDIHKEDEDSLDSDQLVIAINDLSKEGLSTREIAKKLNISLSEVVLAYSIIEKQA
ncbi:tetratricopeptide repeat protein [Candidatus Latescibacterota bacterium]